MWVKLTVRNVDEAAEAQKARHGADTTKIEVFSCRVVPATQEEASRHIRMQLAVGAADGAIGECALHESSYGWTEETIQSGTGMLEGLMEALPPGDAAMDTLRIMDSGSVTSAGAASRQVTYRTGFKAASGISIPSAVEVRGKDDSFVLTVMYADRLDGVIEVNKADGKIKSLPENVRCVSSHSPLSSFFSQILTYIVPSSILHATYQQARFMFGFNAEYLREKTLQSIIPAAGRVQDLLQADESQRGRGGLRASAKSVGARKEMQATHADGFPLTVAVIGMLKKNDPETVVLYVSVEQPRVVPLPEPTDELMQAAPRRSIPPPSKSVTPVGGLNTGGAGAVAPKARVRMMDDSPRASFEGTDKPKVKVQLAPAGAGSGSGSGVTPNDEDSDGERPIRRKGRARLGQSKVPSPDDVEPTAAAAGGDGDDRASNNGSDTGSDGSGGSEPQIKVSERTRNWVDKLGNDDKEAEGEQGRNRSPSPPRDAIALGGPSIISTMGGAAKRPAVIKVDSDRDKAAAYKGGMSVLGSPRAHGEGVNTHHLSTLEEDHLDFGGIGASTAGTDVDVTEEGHRDDGLIYEKHKRLKKLQRILASPRARRAITMFRNLSVGLVLGLLVLHVINFATTKGVTDSFQVNVLQVRSCTLRALFCDSTLH